MIINNKYLKFHLILFFIIILSSFICYANTIDINGLRVNLGVEVIKENINIGKSIDESNEFNSKEYDTKDKEAQDKSVKVKLSIKNNNPYETSDVKVEEIIPGNFSQYESEKNNKITSFQLSKQSEKVLSYNYKYQKNILIEQYNSIKYDEDGNILNNNIDTNISIGDKNRVNIATNNIIISSPEEDLRKGTNKIILFILIFIGCIIMLYVFIMFYKTIKGNDSDFFNDNDDPFKDTRSFILIIAVSMIISIIFGSKEIYSKSYQPQIYEYGKSYEKVIYEAVDFNGALYRFAYKIIVTYSSDYIITDEDYEKDTDGDLLVDALEYQYMTDKNDVDTDKDGLSDYIEVMFLDYNPLSDDTFSDGTKDGDRDYDNDKLTNIEEIRYGTDLSNIDTDYDTLNDYDEVNIYNTNPLDVDTDEDLLIDPDELKLGLDPTNPRTDGITLDSDRKIEQNYTMTNVPEDLREGDMYFKSINAEAAGLIDNAIKINKYMNANLDNSKAVVGNTFKVDNVNGYELNIVLDVSKVSKRAKFLIVCKYEDKELVPIETTVNDSNELKCEITDGVYCIVDSDLILRELSIYNDKYVVR